MFFFNVLLPLIMKEPYHWKQNTIIVLKINYLTLNPYFYFSEEFHTSCGQFLNFQLLLLPFCEIQLP
jgi:hypothetical protein